MAIRGLSALVLVASLAGPALAARQGLSDDELSLEVQIGAQDDDQSSSAARQEDIQMQNNSLTGGPSADQIRKASATAGFGVKVYNSFALGGSITSFQSIGGLVIGAGIKIWVGQMRIHVLKLGLCAEFMQHDFGSQMQTVWDDVIAPALARSARQCNACDSEAAACPTGKMKSETCYNMAIIAERWLLYMETFLHVLTYITAHSELCPRYISAIQTSWNDMAEGTQLAYGTSKWVYEFWWSDFMNHPVRVEQRDSSMKGVDKQLDLRTAWNPFRPTSALDRIIGVAKSLGIYNSEGKVVAKECLPIPDDPPQGSAAKCCRCEGGSIARSASGDCSPCGGEVAMRAPLPSGCNPKDGVYLGDAICAERCEAALAEAEARALLGRGPGF